MYNSNSATRRPKTEQDNQPCFWTKRFAKFSNNNKLIRAYGSERGNNKQQQQNFINKQIKLQKYCPQLARLFEAGQCKE